MLVPLLLATEAALEALFEAIEAALAADRLAAEANDVALAVTPSA